MSTALYSALLAVYVGGGFTGHPAFLPWPGLPRPDHVVWLQFHVSEDLGEGAMRTSSSGML